MLAHAAPDDGFAVSNDAALRGGTAVVLGRDAASVWYNPAAAATVERVRIEASLSVYGLRHTRAPQAVAAHVGEERRTEPGRETHVVVVPSSIAFGFEFPEQKLGLVVAVHNTRYADVEARASISGRNEAAGYAFEQSFNTLALRRRYHMGATLGWEPHPRFRVGFTLGGMFDKNLQFTRLAVLAESDEGPSQFSGVADLDAASRVVGGEAALGIESQITEHLYLGASLRSPAVAVWRKFDGGETVAVTAIDGAGIGATQTLLDRGINRNAPRWITPWRVAIGVAWKFDRGLVELDVDGTTGRRDVGQLWRQRPTFNVSLGGSHQVGKRWELGGGIFTDRTTSLRGSVYPDVVVDRWGGSFATRLRTPVRLAHTERAETLVFETTVALRYAVGVGTAGRFVARYPDSGAQDVSIDTGGTDTRAWQHLVALHVGTGLRF